MSGPQRVLFPIEFSSDYPALTPAARQMFDRRDVDIIMLHTLPEQPLTLRGLDVARSVAQMEFLARREFTFARNSQYVERGRPADWILAYAATKDIDAILLPANAPESLRREIVAKAPCSLWIDWPMEPARGARHVCCAVALESADAAVLCRAAEAAAELDGELTILHAVVPESPMTLWWDADAVAQEIRSARAQVEDLREKFAPNAHIHVEAGRVDWVVNQALHRLDAGLLVAGGDGEAIMAASATCPALRVSASQPRALSHEDALAATA